MLYFDIIQNVMKHYHLIIPKDETLPYKDETLAFILIVTLK